MAMVVCGGIPISLHETKHFNGVLVFAHIFFSVGKYLIQSWIGYIFLSMFNLITLTTIYIIESKITELKEK